MPRVSGSWAIAPLVDGGWSMRSSCYIGSARSVRVLSSVLDARCARPRRFIRAPLGDITCPSSFRVVRDRAFDCLCSRSGDRFGRWCTSFLWRTLLRSSWGPLLWSLLAASWCLSVTAVGLTSPALWVPVGGRSSCELSRVLDISNSVRSPSRRLFR